MWRGARGLLISLIAAAALSACSRIPTEFGTPEPPAALGGESLRLLDSRQIDPRLAVLTLQTPALAAPTRLQILLPDGYGSMPEKRYPVLYLLQGAIDDYTAWTREGDAEALSAGYPMIIVMPDAGDDGYYSDWYNGGAFGQPQWETYHIQQLIPWIDAHYRTIAARRGRAVGGVSMGGFGAVSYAARHPDLFAAVISFSGLVDSNSRSDRYSIPERVFGPRATQEIRWRGHNPCDLAGNLHGVDVTLYTRSGWPGKGYVGVSLTEIIVHRQSVELHRQLLAAKVPHHWEYRGAGGHRWPTWRSDLGKALPTLAAVFSNPPADPAQVSFTAIEADYRVYGWHVVLDRPVLEFSELADADAHGFSLSGSGSAIVTTPPAYLPGALYAVTLECGDGRQKHLLRSSAAGSLSIRVPLGAANAAQQYTEAAEHSAGTRTYRVTVSIAPAPFAAAPSKADWPHGRRVGAPAAFVVRPPV